MAAQPIVHIDLPATDPKATSAFYADVFGWQVMTPPGYEDYPMFQAEGGPGGGFVRAGGGYGAVQYTVGEPLIYLNSQDIDADLQRVQAHGGEVILPKTEISQVGWWAMFRDPSGNKLGLFTRKQ
jgi:predicted enzyme related to lactoylglutathione lyase